MKASGFNPGDPIDPTDINLIKARDAWIPDAPMKNVKNFTVENVSEKWQTILDVNGAAAATSPLTKNGIYTGQSNMYFNKNLAFTSAKRLFYTMVHEFNHVSQHALMTGTTYAKDLLELSEYHAYNHQSSLGDSNYGGFNPKDVKALMQQFPKKFKTFHYMNFKWTETVKFSRINFN